MRYDIYGKDVTIANKMESGGKCGFVQVSEKTKDMLEIKFPDMFNYQLNPELIKINKYSNETVQGYFIEEIFDDEDEEYID